MGCDRLAEFHGLNIDAGTQASAGTQNWRAVETTWHPNGAETADRSLQSLTRSRNSSLVSINSSVRNGGHAVPNTYTDGVGSGKCRSIPLTQSIPRIWSIPNSMDRPVRREMSGPEDRQTLAARAVLE